MLNIVRLAWVVVGKDRKRFEALSIYGKMELIPMMAPVAMTLKNPFSKPPLGYGVFHKGKRVGWVKELPDAAHYAVAYITNEANKRLGSKP